MGGESGKHPFDVLVVNPETKSAKKVSNDTKLKFTSCGPAALLGTQEIISLVLSDTKKSLQMVSYDRKKQKIHQISEFKLS